MNFVPPSCDFDDSAEPCPPKWSGFCAALGALAALSVFEEATLSPKPGLVCPDSSGSHSDMNWITFVMGAAALAPFWQRQAMYGVRIEHYKPLDSVAEKLRVMGRRM